MKVWNERSIYTESEQIGVIAPNEIQDGVVIRIEEVGEKNNSYRLYLTYDEAMMFSKLIRDFVDNNR